MDLNSQARSAKANTSTELDVDSERGYESLDEVIGAIGGVAEIVKEAFGGPRPPADGGGNDGGGRPPRPQGQGPWGGGATAE